MLLSVNQTQAPIVEPVSLATLKNQCNVDASFTADDALITAFGIAARQYAEKYTRRAFFNQIWQLNLDHFPIFMWSGTINPALRRDWAYYAGIWQGMTIALPKAKCISVDQISYINIEGETVVLDPSTYTVDTTSIPARIVPAPGLYWPLGTLYIPGSCAVNYTAGSYVQQFTETFTVGFSSPPVDREYTPLQSPVTAVTSLTDTEGDDVPYELTDGVVYVASTYGGESLTLTYYAGTTFEQTIGLAIQLLVAHWYLNRESAGPNKLSEIPMGVSALLDMYTVNVLDYESVV